MTTMVNTTTMRRLGQLYLDIYHRDAFENDNISPKEASKLAATELVYVDPQTGSYKIVDRFRGLAGCMAAEVAMDTRELLLNKLILMTKQHLEKGEMLVPTYEGLIEAWRTREIPAEIEELDDRYWDQTGIILGLTESNIFDKVQVNTKYDLCEIEQAHLNLLDMALQHSKYFVAMWATTKEFYRCVIRRNENFLVVIVYKFVGEPHEVASEIIERVHANLSEEEIDSLANAAVDSTGMDEEVCAYRVFDLGFTRMTSADILEKLPRLISKADSAERKQNILIHFALTNNDFRW